MAALIEENPEKYFGNLVSVYPSAKLVHFPIPTDDVIRLCSPFIASFMIIDYSSDDMKKITRSVGRGLHYFWVHKGCTGKWHVIGFRNLPPIKHFVVNPASILWKKLKMEDGFIQRCVSLIAHNTSDIASLSLPSTHTLTLQNGTKWNGNPTSAKYN